MAAACRNNAPTGGFSSPSWEGESGKRLPPHYLPPFPPLRSPRPPTKIFERKKARTALL